MTHPAQQQWMAYLYGELDRTRRATLKAHLRDCPACRANVTAWRKAMGELDRWQVVPRDGAGSPTVRFIRRYSRWAVAALVLIGVGYSVGRFSAPRPVPVEQLQASLETSLKSSLAEGIRHDLRQELGRDVQLLVMEGYVHITDELRDQFRSDLSEYAGETLGASGALTNHLLSRLVESIDAARAADRNWTAAALGEIQRQRLQESALWRNDLKTLAVRTGQELQRTRNDVIELVAFWPPGGDAGAIQQEVDDRGTKGAHDENRH